LIYEFDGMKLFHKALSLQQLFEVMKSSSEVEVTCDEEEDEF